MPFLGGLLAARSLVVRPPSFCRYAGPYAVALAMAVRSWLVAALLLLRARTGRESAARQAAGRPASPGHRGGGRQEAGGRRGDGRAMRASERPTGERQ
jgi:hypothetical protein